MRFRALLLSSVLLLGVLAAWAPASQATCTPPVTLPVFEPLPTGGTLTSATTAVACENATLTVVKATASLTHCDALVDAAIATACAALSASAVVPVGGVPSANVAEAGNACVSEALTSPPQTVCTTTVTAGPTPASGFITITDLGNVVNVVLGYDPAAWSCALTALSPTPTVDCVPLGGPPAGGAWDCTDMVVYAQSLGPGGAVHGRGSCSGSAAPDVQTGDAYGAGTFGVFYGPLGPVTDIQCQALGVFGGLTPSAPYSVTCAD